MKKIFLSVTALFAIAVLAGYNVYSSQNNIKLSDLVLANVEALAQDSESSDTSKCGEKFGKCWRRKGECNPAYGIYYDDCEYTGNKIYSCITACPD